MMKYFSLLFFAVGATRGLCSEIIRTFPEQSISTPYGQIFATSLSLKKGRVSRLTGKIVNSTPKEFDYLGVEIQASDGRGTKFNSSLLRINNAKTGEPKPFSFDVWGRYDFETLSYTIKFVGGTFPANYQFEMLAPTKSSQLQYADQRTDWRFVPANDRISFELVNKSDKTARLDWNQAAFVDFDGKAHKIAPSGIRFIEINSMKAPSTIPPGAKIREEFILTDTVSYSSGWDIQTIFPKCPLCRDLVGKEFGMLFPVEINGETKEYSFRIKTRSVE